MTKRKRVVLGVVGVVALLVGVFLYWNSLGSPRTLTLEVSGEPGRKVVGTVEVDGVSHRLSGALPAKFEYRGRRFTFAVTTADGQPGEQILVKAYIDGKFSCSCRDDGTQGTVHRVQGIGWKTWSEAITGIGPDQIAQLRK